MSLYCKHKRLLFAWTIYLHRWILENIVRTFKWPTHDTRCTQRCSGLSGCLVRVTRTSSPAVSKRFKNGPLWQFWSQTGYDMEVVLSVTAVLSCSLIKVSVFSVLVEIFIWPLLPASIHYQCVTSNVLRDSSWITIQASKRL